MKIELKNLAPYLPYGLKIFIKDESSDGKELILIEMLEGIDKNCLITDNYEYDTVNPDLDYQFKPIFRPLSEFGDSDDLRKVHEFIGLGKWCEQYDFYFACWFNDLANIDKLVLRAPYEISQYFFANHYDFFSLIPKGLALDINTIS